MNPNVIHSTGSSTTVAATVTSASTTHFPSASPTTLSVANNNKSQVITHAKSSSGGGANQPVQAESLVVSVPLSSATTVPGIQLPTTNSSNNNSNSSTISTIVTNQVQQQQQQQQISTVSPASTVPTVVPPSHGSLYQHLTNNQPGNQRASPLIQQGMGRASPITITPTPSPLVNDGHTNSSGSNHTSVLQNMTAASGVICNQSAAFHAIDTNQHQQQAPPPPPPTSAMIKTSYEKQVTPRIQAIQQEETTRRSRYVHLPLVAVSC